jgi:hypothetical protein
VREFRPAIQPWRFGYDSLPFPSQVSLIRATAGSLSSIPGARTYQHEHFGQGVERRHPPGGSVKSQDLARRTWLTSRRLEQRSTILGKVLLLRSKWLQRTVKPKVICGEPEKTQNLVQEPADQIHLEGRRPLAHTHKLNARGSESKGCT